MNHFVKTGEVSNIQIRTKVEEVGVENFDIIVTEASAYIVAAYFYKKGVENVILNDVMMMSTAICFLLQCFPQSNQKTSVSKGDLLM